MLPFSFPKCSITRVCCLPHASSISHPPPLHPAPLILSSNICYRMQISDLWVIQFSSCLSVPYISWSPSSQFSCPLGLESGPGSSVGIATAYGLEGPGIESRWGEIFRICPDRPWGPSSLLYNGYRVFSGGKVLPGRDADPSSPFSAEV